MFDYLVSKAKSKGFEAWKRSDCVCIKLMIAFFGHDKSYTVMEVRNIREYRAIMGDD